MTSAATLTEWFSTPQGQYLLSRESDYFDRSLADIFGFNALQLGLPERDFLRGSRIPLRIFGDRSPDAKVKLLFDELPFESASMDLVLLPHVLEFYEHPHQILREVERVLRPEGYVLITGFNPRSLWGIRRLLGPRQGYPWCGQFITLSRMKDWLALLGFEIEDSQFACYAPPSISSKWLQRFRSMEPAGDRWWAVCGGVYFLLAVKRVPGMRLIKPQWNSALVRKFIPAAPKLNRGSSQCEQHDE